MIKGGIICDKKEKLFSDLKEQLKGEKFDARDGIKIIRGDSWVHIRPSKTEPIIRIFAEAPTKMRAEELLSSVTKKIRLKKRKWFHLG